MVFDADAAHPPDPGTSGATTSGVSVIVVNYRRPDLLADALRALYASSLRPAEVVVVEVESTAAPAIPLDEHDPPVAVQVLAFPDNPGYAAACNRGAALASADWLLFLNADVMVGPATLEAILADVAPDPSIGIATCRLVRPDGSLDHACHRGIPSVLDSLIYKSHLDRLAPASRRLGHYRLSWLDPMTVHDVEACTGAFLLIRRAALTAVGGWDERYWFYAEDLDLCLRVAQAGWRVRYVGTATATHVKGGSSNLRRSSRELTEAQRATRQRVREAAVESHERFYREHLAAGTARPLRPLVRAMFAGQRFLTRHTP